MAENDKDQLAAILEALAIQLSTPKQPSTGIAFTMTGGPGTGNMTGIKIQQTAGPNTKQMTGLDVSVSDFSYAPGPEDIQLAEELRNGARELRDGSTDLSIVRKALKKAGKMSDQVINSALVKFGQELVEKVIAGIS